MTLLVADATNLTHRCWHATGRSTKPEVVAAMLTSLLSAAVERSAAAKPATALPAEPGSFHPVRGVNRCELDSPITGTGWH